MLSVQRSPHKSARNGCAPGIYKICRRAREPKPKRKASNKYLDTSLQWRGRRTNRALSANCMALIHSLVMCVCVYLSIFWKEEKKKKNTNFMLTQRLVAVCSRSLSISCKSQAIVRIPFEFINVSKVCVCLCVCCCCFFFSFRLIVVLWCACTLVMRPMHCLWRWTYYSTQCFFFSFAFRSTYNCHIRLKITKFVVFSLFVFLFKSATSVSVHRHHLASQTRFCGLSKCFSRFHVFKRILIKD